MTHMARAYDEDGQPLQLEIMDFTAYEARIFPPERYIEECELG
jgi:hypothetical protein